MSPVIQWEQAPSLGPLEVKTRKGIVRVRRGRFVGGTAEGVEVVELDSGATSVLVLPTRGMGVWRLTSRGVPFAWASPVRGPVHPAWVPIDDPSGIGWLEGFDELVARCGLESNGAPEFDDRGRVRHPLHGRIANLPASRLALEIDEDAGRVTLTGEVVEARFLVKRLRLQSAISVVAGEPEVAITDSVTNDLTTPATAQLLYHINVGRPLLGDGARLAAHTEWLAPKDDLSRGELERWTQVGPPTAAYHERVYFARLKADARGWVRAAIVAPDGSRGFGVRADAATLPWFTFWKNAAADSDGYVIGIEPATNLPNARSVEEAAGRVVRLLGGQTVTFRIALAPLIGADEVGAFQGTST